MKKQTYIFHFRGLKHGKSQYGFSLIELMISITLGMIVVAAVLTLFLNITRNNSEMAKTNNQVESARFAIQLLQNDLAHAGFWGSHVPQFDDLTFSVTPADVPAAVPDPCSAYALWDAAYKNQVIGIPIQAYGVTPPSGTGCVTNFATNKKASTDVLVVRHAETCLPGVGNCEANNSNKLYFQSPLCELEFSAPVQAATSASITLHPTASATDNFYQNSYVSVISGTGIGQTRLITAYDGATKIATVSDWTIIPDITSKYTFGSGYVLAKSGHTFHKKDCTTLADKRKFISNIYYIRDYAATAGDGIPTLMRASFDANGETLAHQTAQPLIEGIEGFSIRLGVDSLSKTGAAITPTAPITWVDATTKTSPTNRGDGVADGDFIACTDAIPCNVAQLMNVVAVKVYVLARAKETSPGYVDTKTYTLGSTSLGPFNDGFKRHVFSTTVRLINVSGRRETP